ncbi:hypothetical protein [uncultured Bacteroides sp.]|uniref:hypothetical protein n=1 Tax=uncultured Bacteroides sp. TaxID=162156 RepID=UPI00260DD8A2|nr:hypothetical protein [uncultured Bacteroides sp.]
MTEEELKKQGIEPIKQVDLSEQVSSVQPENIFAKETVALTPSEAYQKYSDLTPAQYLHAQSQFRRDLNMPALSYSDIAVALRGRDPYESEEEKRKREEKLQRQERANNILSGIGSFLGNLYNVYRTSRGNPSMQIESAETFRTPGYNRINAIRNYNEQLRRSNYTDYLNALYADRKVAAAAAAAERDFQQEVMLKKMEYNSPLNMIKMQNEIIKGQNLQREGDYTEARTRKEQAETEWLPKKYELDQRMANARIQYYRKRAAAAGSGGSGSKKNEFVRVGDRTFSPAMGSDWVSQAYYYMLRNGGSDYKVDAGILRPISENDMLNKIAEYNDNQSKKSSDDDFLKSARRNNKNNKAPLN